MFAVLMLWWSGRITLTRLTASWIGILIAALLFLEVLERLRI